MPRFESYSQRDTPDVTGGDSAFQFIDMTRDKPNVAAGGISLGQNTRLRTGRVKQRKGTFMAGDFNPPTGFGNYLVGSGVFRDPDGAEWLVVAPAGAEYTWALRHGRDPLQINYDAAVTGNNGLGGGVNGVEFVQAFDKLLLLRRPLQGAPAENLVWSGAAAGTWLVTTLSAAGRTLVPGMFNGEPFMDRIIFYKANAPGTGTRDQWLITDDLDYTSYDTVYQAFTTNSAEADYITRIMAHYRNSVIIFKNQSIHMSEFLPTFPVSRTERIINKTIGSVGNKMPLMVGGDILFASMPQGFFSLSEVIQEQVATLPTPISEPIQRVIDDINWPITLQMGCSVSLDNYAFFGVALGRGSTRLNAVLVYNTARPPQEAWESAGDTWADPSFAFNALHVTNYDAVQRVFAVDYLTGAIYLLYEGLVDELVTGTFNVPFKMETRGYTGDNPMAFKRFGRGTVIIGTYEPHTTITAITDGFNEEKVVSQITKDRNRFYQHGKANFNVLTDDPTEQKREDYSLTEPDNVIVDDFEDLPAGQITSIPPTAPPILGPIQQTREPFLVRSFGAHCSFRIENDEGAVEVAAVAVESTPAVNTTRTAA